MMLQRILFTFILFFQLLSPENNEQNIENLIIIGSGPAGLTAAIYAARANLNPLLFEGENPGGQLAKTTFIENWPGHEKILGSDLMENMKNQALQFGTRIISSSVVDVDFSKSPFLIKTDLGEIFKTKAVIVATGSTPKMLEIPQEKIYFGKNISTCAVCDGALYKNKKVLIIGGGDSAMEYALFLRKFTKDITIIHRSKELSASHAMKKEVLNDPDIKILYNTEVKEFHGDGHRALKGLIINNKTKTLNTIKFDGVFLAIGSKPNTEIFKGKLHLDSRGYIKTHDQVKTSIEGIFAAGDVQDFTFRQAITSAADGAKAAMEAEKYLTKKTLPQNRSKFEKKDISEKEISKCIQSYKKIKQKCQRKNNKKLLSNDCNYYQDICCN